MGEQLWGMGIAGAILGLVVVPLLYWLMRELKESREQFMRFLGNHQHEENVLFGEIKQLLQDLKQVVRG